jgi:hypothetical protein
VNEQEQQGAPEPQTQAIPDAPASQPNAENSSTQTSEATNQDPNLDEAQKAQKRRDNGVQRRINEIIRDRENYKATADRERQERMRLMDLLEKSRGEPARTPQQSGTQAPKIEDYTKYEDYLMAQAEWAADRRYDQRHQEAQRHHEQARHNQVIADQHRHLENQQRTLQTLVDKAEEKYPDFYEKVFTQDPSVVPISAVVGAAILESDQGSDVAYYLGTHPTEAQRIAKLSPTSQLREFGKIEVMLTKPQSAAPPPLNPVSGKRVHEGMPTGEEKDFKDFLAKRNRQLGRK